MVARSSLALLGALALTLAPAMTGCASEAADPPGATEEPAPAAKIDLGTVDADADVEVDVPEGTTGFTVVVDATVSRDDSIGVRELRAPDGTPVIADFLPVGVKEGRYQTGSIGVDVGVVRFPFVGDDAGTKVKAGKWHMKLGGQITDPKQPKGGALTPWSGRMHGVVFLQSAPGATFGGGAIDLDLYVPEGLVVGTSKGAPTVTSATAGDAPGIKQRLDLAFGLFQRLWGLERGEVRFHAIPASFKDIEGQDGIDEANKQATFVGERPSAQIILTNALVPDGEISGISNCLPGAVGVPSTRCSAVIVSLRAESDSELWIDASTLVHEVGHFMGLEHTTEFGRGEDALSDTPVCSNTEEKGALQSCPDVDNIMFPTSNLATSEPSIWASEKQKLVVQTSPIFRAKR